MRNHKLKLLCMSLLGLGVVSALGQERAPFQEVGGVVVMEAENFTSRVADPDDEHHWHAFPADEGSDEFGDSVDDFGIDYSIGARPGNLSSVNPGVSGYIVSLPDGGQNQNNMDEILDSAPSIDYKVKITTPGEYQLFLRWTGFNGSSDSIYARVVELEGSPAMWYRYSGGGGPFDSDFSTGGGATGWDGTGTPDVTSAGGGEEPALWNVPSPGTYTIRIQQREDGSGVDAILFQLASLDPPDGDGPTESTAKAGPPEPLKIVATSPSDGSQKGAFNKGISVTFLEGTTTLDQGSVVLELDGAKVTPTFEKQGDVVVTASFLPDKFFAPRSPHTAKITAKDSAGADLSVTFSFTTKDFLLVPAAYAVTPDTSKPGFKVRTHQVAFGVGNSVARAEAQLAGELIDPDTGDVAENVADDFGFKNGIFEEETYINYNQDAVDRLDPVSQAGRFGANQDPNPRFENPIPGIPGVEGSTDNIAVEVLTFIDLPAGIVNMTLNSDDGFKITVSPGDPRDKFGSLVGQFDGGRGSSDSNMQFVVEEAGVYPFRLIWFEGNGGANFEWSIKDADGNRVLVNDTEIPGHRKAFREAQGGATVFAQKVDPSPGAVNVPGDAGILVELVDGATPVDKGSITLKLDGQDLSPNLSKSGSVTTINWDNPGLFVAASAHDVELAYAVGGKTINRTWRYTVTDFATLDCNLGTAIGSGSSRGFSYVISQVEPSQGTTIKRAEDQLAGLLKDTDGNPLENLADPSKGTTDIINFDQDGGANGNFTDLNGFLDDFIPGIPGVTGSTDNIAGEFTAFVEFPEAGFFNMGVNSDDGFEVSVGMAGERDAPVLGQFNAGRGAADTIFGFAVPVAGVYPMRLIWFEGGGGANVEWFTIKDDGTKVLLNDSKNGGLSAFRSRSDTKLNCPAAVAGAVKGIKFEGGNITVTFDGLLQSSDQVAGPYTDVAGAPTGGADQTFTITPGTGHKFYIAR